MKLRLPQAVVLRLRRELRGRIREIGGVLAGEHVGGDTFRVVDISVQRSGGTWWHFVRDPQHARRFLAEFFKRQGHDYTRFNYLGEWHSHPRFRPLPSHEDAETMAGLVADPEVGANFLVLIIARLHWSTLEMSATLYRPDAPPEPVTVEIEDGEGDRSQSPIRRFLDFIRERIS